MSDRLMVYIESNTTGTGALFFERAQELGLQPVLLAADPSRYPFLGSHRNVEVGVQSLSAYWSAITRLARDERIAGVWSSSDSHVANAARISRALGLSYADPVAVELCRDKYLCRQSLAEHGLLTPPFTVARSGTEAAMFANCVGGAVVVKPRSSTGSIGVQLCRTADAAGRHADYLLESDTTPKGQGILVEGFVDGPEYSVEIFDGRAIGLTRKHLGSPPSFVETGHEFPAAVDRHARDVLIACAETAVCAVGHHKGPAHVEVRLGDEGAYVVEINPRLAGGMIPELIQRATGIDLISASIQFACGTRYDLAATRNRAAAIRFMLRPENRVVTAVSGVQQALQVAGIVNVAVMERAFGRNGPVQDFRDRIAYAIAEADDPAIAAHIADKGLSNLTLTSIPVGKERQDA